MMMVKLVTAGVSRGFERDQNIGNPKIVPEAEPGTYSPQPGNVPMNQLTLTNQLPSTSF